MSGYTIGDWVHYDAWDLGVGTIEVDLGEGMVRVRFARGEATVRTSRLRPATEKEIAAAKPSVSR
jgi:hypothetical protein